MPHVVLVAMTVDRDEPEQAVAVVRAELAAKLATEAQPWQTGQPHLLPRWQIASVRRVARRNEQDGVAG